MKCWNVITLYINLALGLQLEWQTKNELRRCSTGNEIISVPKLESTLSLLMHLMFLINLVINQSFWEMSKVSSNGLLIYPNGECRQYHKSFMKTMERMIFIFNVHSFWSLSMKRWLHHMNIKNSLDLQNYQTFHALFSYELGKKNPSNIPFAVHLFTRVWNNPLIEGSRSMAEFISFISQLEEHRTLRG